jgi:transposase
VQSAIAAQDAHVLYLPPYSPDLSPIEQGWSKLKTYLRQAKARTRQTLDIAMTDALATISVSDARSWFQQCGYALP